MVVRLSVDPVWRSLGAVRDTARESLALAQMCSPICEPETAVASGDLDLGNNSSPSPEEGAKLGHAYDGIMAMSSVVPPAK